jgi:hypothetical protein
MRQRRAAHLDRISNDFARYERVFHARRAVSLSVADDDWVVHEGFAAGGLDLRDA